MATQAEKQLIRRSENRFGVPYPLLEGLVFAHFGGTAEEQRKAHNELSARLAENRLVKIIDSN